MPRRESATAVSRTICHRTGFLPFVISDTDIADGGCQELMKIHRDFFQLWSDYKQKTTKVLPSTEEREAALRALARSSTMRFNIASKSLQSSFSFARDPAEPSMSTLRPQSSFLSKDSCGNSPIASVTRHLSASLDLDAKDPRVLARSDEYLSDVFDHAVRCLKWLGPAPALSLAMNITWDEFRTGALDTLISERVVSRECHACLSGLTMRNDPYRERLLKTKVCRQP